MAETWEEVLEEMGKEKGTFCCPVCYSWYETREQKDRCMEERHGYVTLKYKENG